MGRPRTWTDDDLRAAVAGARTMAEVVRRLRLSRGGAAYVTVRSRMEQLGLRLDGQPDHARPDVPTIGRRRGRDRRTWSEDDLERAVAGSTSLNEVFTRLQLTVGGSQWLVVRSLILERGWSTAHWNAPLDRQERPDGSFRAALDGADLTALVVSCRNRAEVIRSLGGVPSSNTYRQLRDALVRDGVSIEHLEPPDVAMRRAPRVSSARPLADVLVQGSTYTSTTTLKRRLVAEGLLEPRCAVCRIDQWRGRPLTLHLDHVNGRRDDHRLENLRLLCPNCHSQTRTYAGRNRGRYADVEQPGTECGCDSLRGPDGRSDADSPR